MILKICKTFLSYSVSIKSKLKKANLKKTKDKERGLPCFDFLRKALFFPRAWPGHYPTGPFLIPSNSSEISLIWQQKRLTRFFDYISSKTKKKKDYFHPYSITLLNLVYQKYPVLFIFLPFLVTWLLFSNNENETLDTAFFCYALSAFGKLYLATLFPHKKV